MDLPTRQFIETIHQAPYQCVLALTGGGTTTAAQLLEVPGGSRTILEVIVPYSDDFLTAFLGRRPEQFCSAETSVAMARRAYERACWLAAGVPVVGVGSTASLATDRPKRGDHRFHVSYYRSDGTSTQSLVLSKGARDRAGEEAVLVRVILNALARGLSIEQQLDVPLLPSEEIKTEACRHEGPRTLFDGGSEAVWVAPDGQWQAFPPERQIAAILPGSFNPVHEGHWALASVAEKMLQAPVVFELSIDNVDKPSLPEEEVRRRLTQFHWRAPVVLTRAPIFAKKASLFPGATFIVGSDTAVRIVAPRYYESEAAMRAALHHIRDQHCRFLAAGRLDPGGKYLDLDGLTVPAEFRDLFHGIPAEAFRMDISSTLLRAGSHHAAQEKANRT